MRDGNMVMVRRVAPLIRGRMDGLLTLNFFNMPLHDPERGGIEPLRLFRRLEIAARIS